MFAKSLFLTIILCILTAVAATTPIFAADPASIEELCAAAKQAYSPLKAADLEKAKTALLEKIAFLEDRLREDGENGQEWNTYLKLDKLKEQLAAAGGPQAETLAKIQERFDAENAGLNLIWFAEVRRTLWRYRTIDEALKNPELQKGFEGLMGELPARLKQYAESPTANLSDQIGAVAAWVEMIGQAEMLLAAIDENYRRPNLLLSASHNFVAAGMSREIDREEPITDCILGMYIRGDGRTTGTLTVETIPNGGEAIIEMLMEGRTESKNVGSRGAVRVYSDAITTFTARKRIFVNGDEIHSEPATCEAECDTTITGICATNGMRLVENVARKRVSQNFCQAQWIAARHAEDRVCRQFDAQAEELLAEANQSYADSFREPLWQRGLFPNKMQIASTDSGIDVTALAAEADQLAASSEPPQAPASDLALRMHESFVNNLAAEALAGRTLGEEEMLSMLKDALGRVPEHFQAEAGEAPWAITFAAKQPLVFIAKDNGFTIVIHTDAFARGDSEYPGMDITAVYKIEKTADGYKAVRQGEVSILPPGFEVGKDTRLSVRQQTLRELIGRRFDKAFRKEIIPEPLELTGRWKKLGKLPLSHWQTADGWIITTWKLP